MRLLKGKCAPESFPFLRDVFTATDYLYNNTEFINQRLCSSCTKKCYDCITITRIKFLCNFLFLFEILSGTIHFWSLVCFFSVHEIWYLAKDINDKPYKNCITSDKPYKNCITSGEMAVHAIFYLSLH